MLSSGMQNVQAFFSEEELFWVTPQNKCVYIGGGILHRNNLTSLRGKKLTVSSSKP